MLNYLILAISNIHPWMREPIGKKTPPFHVIKSLFINFYNKTLFFSLKIVTDLQSM